MLCIIFQNIVNNNELVTEMCGMNCHELSRLGGPGGCGTVNGCKDRNFDWVKYCPRSCGLRGTFY